MYNFTTQSSTINAGRIVYMYTSNELNIAYVTSTNKCTFSYNLDLVQKSEAERQMTEFSAINNCSMTVAPGHPADLNVLCFFPDEMTDDEVLQSLNRYFNIK